MADTKKTVKRIDITFKYGENATDMKSEYSKPHIVTGILPYGEDGNGATIRINGTVLWHTKSVKKYGYVLEVVDFGKLTTKVLKKQSDGQTVLTTAQIDALKTKLTNKAKRWMTSRLKDFPDKVTVKGVDNYYLGRYHYRTHIGDTVTCESKLHGINVTAACLSMDIDYFNHENDSYVIGPYIPSNFYDPKITMQ